MPAKANRAGGDGAAAEVVGVENADSNSQTTSAVQARRCIPIRAELLGSNICRAAGLTARSTTPVLAMCRRLVEAGHDPELRLDVFRGDVLALRVRSIGEAAELEVAPNKYGVPRFVRRRDRNAGGGTASLVRNSEGAAVLVPFRQDGGAVS